MNVAKMDTYTKKIFDIVHEIMNERAPSYLCVSLASARHELLKAILAERVHQEDAQYASAYRNDMKIWDGLYEHAYGSVKRRLEISADYDHLMDARIEALIKDFDGLVADDMCVRFEEVRRRYTRAVFRDGYLRTHLDIRKWRIAMIDKELLHLFSTFKNGVIQQLEEMERKCTGLDGFYGRGTDIYMTVLRLARAFALHYHLLRTNFRKCLNQTLCFRTKNKA